MAGVRFVTAELDDRRNDGFVLPGTGLAFPAAWQSPPLRSL